DALGRSAFLTLSILGPFLAQGPERISVPGVGRAGEREFADLLTPGPQVGNVPLPERARVPLVLGNPFVLPSSRADAGRKAQGSSSLKAPRRRTVPSPFPGMNPYFEQTAHWLDFHSEFLSALRRLLAPQVAPKYIVQLEAHIYIHDVPTQLSLLKQDVEKVPFLEVRDRQGRELVTAIELLSPSNKRSGEDREQYLAKRRDLLPVIPIPLRSPDAAARVDLQEALHRAYDGPGYEHFIYSGEPEPSLPANDAAWARQFVPAGE